jgi:hypothetical protein
VKNKVILITFLLLSLHSEIFAQRKYYDLNFERCSTTDKNLIQWKYQTIGTEFFIDSATYFNGKSSMYTNLRHVDISNGVPFYFIMPKLYYPGLRNIEISVRILFRNEKPNAGLWCTVKKDNELLGSASTLKGNLTSTIIPYTATIGTSVPVIPYTWTPFDFAINFSKDPTLVIIGFIVMSDRAWFDDIEIKLNGNPLTNLAFILSNSN